MATQDHLSPFPTGFFDQPDHLVMNDLTGKLEEVDSTPFAGGGYADVYMYRPVPGYLEPGNEGRLFAVKTLRPKFFIADRRRATARLAREIAVWDSLQHDNILKLHGILYSRKNNGIPSLVSDFMENGTADEYLKRCPGANLLQVIRDAARGLAHLHRMNYAHGDIKANNILVGGDGRARFSDFGLSRMLGSDGRAIEITTTDGNRSNRWHAVEYFKFNSSTNVGPTKPADVWSFGCTVLELFSGVVPFHGVKEAEIGIRLAKGERPKFPPFVSRPEFAKYKAAIVAFCTLCWTKNPESRPQMSSLEELACSDYWDEACNTPEPCEQRRTVDTSPPDDRPSSILSPSPSPSTNTSPRRSLTTDSESSAAAPPDGLRSRSASQATLVSSPSTDEDLKFPIPVVVEPEEDPQPDPAPDGTLPGISDQPPPSLEDMLRTKNLKPRAVLNEASMGPHRFKVEFIDDESTGPSHIRTHVVSCKIDDEVYGVGTVTGKKAQARDRAALRALQRLYLEKTALFTVLRYAPVLTSYLDEHNLSARASWDRLEGPSPEDPTKWEHRASFIFDGNVIATGVGPTPAIAEEDAARKVQVAWTCPYPGSACNTTI